MDLDIHTPDEMQTVQRALGRLDAEERSALFDLCEAVWEAPSLGPDDVGTIHDAYARLNNAREIRRLLGVLNVGRAR